LGRREKKIRVTPLRCGIAWRPRNQRGEKKEAVMSAMRGGPGARTYVREEARELLPGQEGRELREQSKNVSARWSKRRAGTRWNQVGTGKVARGKNDFKRGKKTEYRSTPTQKGGTKDGGNHGILGGARQSGKKVSEGGRNARGGKKLHLALSTRRNPRMSRKRWGKNLWRGQEHFYQIRSDPHGHWDG